MAEPVILARKILSCVARVGQRFGAGHVTNVLRGSDGEQVADARPRGLEHVRPAARVRRSTKCAATSISCWRTALLRADRRRVSSAAADRRRRRDDEAAERAAATSRWRDSAGRRRAERRRASRIEVRVLGRRRSDRSSSGCAPCVWRSRVRAACRRTSSFTTRRCASWRASNHDRWPSSAGVYGMGAKKIDALGGVILETIRASA